MYITHVVSIEDIYSRVDQALKANRNIVEACKHYYEPCDFIQDCLTEVTTSPLPENLIRNKDENSKSDLLGWAYSVSNKTIKRVYRDEARYKRNFKNTCTFSQFEQVLFNNEEDNSFDNYYECPGELTSLYGRNPENIYLVYETIKKRLSDSFNNQDFLRSILSGCKRELITIALELNIKPLNPRAAFILELGKKNLNFSKEEVYRMEHKHRIKTAIKVSKKYKSKSKFKNSKDKPHWDILNKEKLLDKIGHFKPKQILHVPTGQLFNTAKEASTALGKNISYASKKLKKGHSEFKYV